MSSINYIFNVQIQGQRISTLENVANTLLTPAFYFWNGKKVDYIQDGNQSVCHYKPIFADSDKVSNEKVAFYGLAIIPSLLVGGLLKCIAVLFHTEETKSLVGRCVAGESNKFYALNGSGDLLATLLGLFQDLHELKDSRDKTVLLFLSEWGDLRLHGPNIDFSLDYGVSYRPLFERNARILSNIQLLWNLQVLETRNHYHYSVPTEMERRSLWKMNPLIIWEEQSNKRENRQLAQDFLKSKGWKPPNVSD